MGRTTESGSGGGRRRRRPTAARIARAVLWVVLAGWAVYLAGMNLFLSTSLFGKVVNADPDSILVGYERGWSWLPGRIHARKLSIRGRDSNVEWVLRIDAVRFDLSFIGLARRRFEARNVSGDTISFRLRQRLDAPPVSEAEVADLPPIDGFGPYSVHPPKVETPDVWHDEAYALWTAHLEGVTAEHVREVWIDHDRFEGDARITGRFYLKPIRYVEVGPVRTEIREGEALRGGRREAEELAGTFGVTLRGFDPRVAKGEDLARRLALDTDLRATCPALGDLPWPKGAEVGGSAEIRRLALRIRDGILREPSRVEVRGRGVSVAAKGHRVAGDVDASGEVAGDRLTFRSELDGVTIGRAAEAPGIVRAPRVTVAGDSAALQVARPFGDLHAVLDVPDADLPDARALFAYLPKDSPIAIEEGRARAEGRLEAWLGEARATARAKLRADPLTLRIAKARVRGVTSAEGSVDSIRWRKRELEGAKLAVRVSDGILASANAPRDSLVKLHELRIDSAAPYVDLADPLRTLSARIAIPEASIVSQTLLHAYLPKGTEMRIVSARARFSLECDVAIESHLARGTLDARSTRFGVAYRDLDLTGDVGLHARVHDWRWETGDLALDDASIDVTGIGVTAGGRPGLSAGRVSVDARAPRLDLAKPTFRGVDLRLVVDGADVKDARALQAFVPDTSLLFIESGAGRVSADVAIESARQSARGDVIVDLHDARVRSRAMTLGGDFRIVGRVNGFGPDPGALDVSGSGVHMQNVEVLGAEGGASHWYGNLVLPKATLRIDPDPGLDADLELEARDAKPLVAILLQHGLPKVLGRMADVPALSISARLTATKGLLALPDVAVHGGDLTVRGSYASRDPHRSGAFVVTKGLLSVGMRLGDDGTHVRLFGLEGWLKDETQNTIQLMKGKAAPRPVPPAPPPANGGKGE